MLMLIMLLPTGTSPLRWKRVHQKSQSEFDCKWLQLEGSQRLTMHCYLWWIYPNEKSVTSAMLCWKDLQKSKETTLVLSCFIYIHLVGMSMCLKPIVRLQKATFDLVHHPMSLAMSSCPSRRFNISWWNTTTLKGWSMKKGSPKYDKQKSLQAASSVVSVVPKCSVWMYEVYEVMRSSVFGRSREITDSSPAEPSALRGSVHAFLALLWKRLHIQDIQCKHVRWVSWPLL